MWAMRWVVCFASLAGPACSFQLPPAQVGDGPPNGSDAAPCVASDPHDEDGDGVADQCDGCPQLANAAATDTDHDTIPDACDPHPARAGDVLVTFETFATASGAPPNGWLPRGGGSANDWTSSGDELRVTSGNDTHLLVFDTGSPNHTIDVGFDLVSVSSTAFQFVTAIADSKDDITQFIGCGIRVDTLTPAPDREVVVHDANAFATPLVDVTERPTPSGTYRMVMTVSKNLEFCTIPTGQNPHTIPGTLQTHDNRFVGLRLNNATIAVRYIAVYKD
jgi:hypothetical protein